MDAPGRRRERREIADLALGEHDGMLVFTGPPGIGKTRLLEDARAAHRAALVRVDASESAWPLAGLSALLSSIDDRRAAEFGGRFRLRSADPEEILTAAHDLLSMLRGLSLGPTLVLIDDVDLMDAESRALLRSMAPRLQGTGLRVVATRRDAPDPPMAGLELRQLDPLDDDDAFELLVGEAGHAAHEGTLRILVQQSGGLPRDLLDGLRTLTGEQLRGREPLVLPLPRPAGDVESDDRPGVRTALELVALAPRMPRPVAQLIGIPHDAIDELLGDGTLEQQAQTVRIASPVLRSKIVGSMQRPDRLRRHRRLAQAASSAGVAWSIAWHESFVTPDGAGRRLLRAGVELADELDVRSAVEVAERALRLYGVDAEDLDLLLELSRALLRAGEPAIASRLLLHAPLEHAESAVAVTAARLDATASFSRTHRVPIEEVEGAVEQHGRAAPDECAGLLATASAFHLVRGELGPARALLAQAHPLLEHARPGTVRLHDGVRAFADAVEGVPVSIPLPPEADDSEPEASVHRLVTARTLSLTERHDLARQSLFVTLQRLGGGDRHLGEVARLIAAENEIRAGEVGRARETAHRWLETMVHRPRTASRLLLETWLAFADGRPDDARELGELCLERAAEEGDHTVTARLLAFQGEVALISGDADEAVRLLRTADLAAAPIGNPAWTRHAADLVHALARVGRMQEAESVAASLRSRRADRPSRWMALAGARIAALLTPDDRAPARFEEAIAAFRPEDSRFELAKVLLGRADVEARAGDQRGRAATLSEARAAFEQAGAAAWASLTMPAVAPPGALDNELTPDEAEVLRLVRLGYRNKEIARTLFVSLRTVELRMTHIFRKTGASSRAQLGAMSG